MRGYAPSGERVPPFDHADIAALEGYVQQVGWTELPLLQPKQVEPTGVACLVRALKGTVIKLVQSEDNNSDTSNGTTLDSSQPLDRSERDPLGLDQGSPELEEGECRASSPEAMDQDEALGHGGPLDEGSTSEAGMAFGQRTDSQSEEMDINVHYSDSEGLSRQPMETQDARDDRGHSELSWDEGENEVAKRRQLYPKVRPYAVPVYQDIDNGWYQREDLMDPNDVAPPACRIGLPNVDGSIGGDNRLALPPPMEPSTFGSPILRAGGATSFGSIRSSPWYHPLSIS